jgi:hypothetical protein
MARSPLLSLLALSLLASLPLGADEHGHGRGHDRDERKEWKDDDREDRKAWKEQEKAEKRYWKEREREGREYLPHRYDDEGRGHGRGHRPPPWMDSYWRPGDSRRYVALVPGDPSRMYVFLEGRWVLRRVLDPRARLDLEGAFRLPMAPPPIAPPRLGVDLHVVLFN